MKLKGLLPPSNASIPTLVDAALAHKFTHHDAGDIPTQAAANEGLTFIYASHPRWPLQPGSSSPQRTDKIARNLSVSILDSSFNPAHLAHLALATRAHPGSAPGNSSPTPNTDGNTTHIGQREDFDAHLLILGTKNADKMPKEGDPTIAQKLEMMRLLAFEMQSRDATESPQQDATNERRKRRAGNVAVAMCNEPTFVAKARLLQKELRILIENQLEAAESETESKLDSKNGVPDMNFTFVQGWDTFVRFFASKYYPPPSSLSKAMQTFFEDYHSSLLVAHRGSTSPDPENVSGSSAIPQKEIDEFLQQEEVNKWIKKGRVHFFSFDPRHESHLTGISSTCIRDAVREYVKDGNASGSADLTRRPEAEKVLNRMLPKTIKQYIIDNALYL